MHVRAEENRGFVDEVALSGRDVGCHSCSLWFWVFDDPVSVIKPAMHSGNVVALNSTTRYI